VTASHVIFRGGETGRRRSANAAAAELWRRLGESLPGWSAQGSASRRGPARVAWPARSYSECSRIRSWQVVPLRAPGSAYASSTRRYGPADPDHEDVARSHRGQRWADPIARPALAPPRVGSGRSG